MAGRGIISLLDRRTYRYLSPSVHLTIPPANKFRERIRKLRRLLERRGLKFALLPRILQSDSHGRTRRRVKVNWISKTRSSDTSVVRGDPCITRVPCVEADKAWDAETARRRSMMTRMIAARFANLSISSEEKKEEKEEEETIINGWRIEVDIFPRRRG